MKITYLQIWRTGVRSGRCPVCGKQGRRTQRFMQTVNPFNKNPDGTVRTRQEAAVTAEAAEWSAGQFVHAKCYGRTWVPEEVDHG